MYKAWGRLRKFLCASQKVRTLEDLNFCWKTFFSDVNIQWYVHAVKLLYPKLEQHNNLNKWLWKFFGTVLWTVLETSSKTISRSILWPFFIQVLDNFVNTFGDILSNKFSDNFKDNCWEKICSCGYSIFAMLICLKIYFRCEWWFSDTCSQIAVPKIGTPTPFGKTSGLDWTIEGTVYILGQ